MTKTTLSVIQRSVVIRPLTIVYLVGVLIILLTVNKFLSLTTGLLVFGMATIWVLLISVYGELLAVHTLVNAQHDELVLRNEQLVHVLQTAGVEIPNTKPITREDS